MSLTYGLIVLATIIVTTIAIAKDFARPISCIFWFWVFVPFVNVMILIQMVKALIIAKPIEDTENGR